MTDFEWDNAKEALNIAKHGVSFSVAALAFSDANRLIAPDEKHSLIEKRWLCFGKVGTDILTVRFTYRGARIRIIGAASWRKGRKAYEEEWEKRQKGHV